MGCPPNTYDLDMNPITGGCGCEYNCAKTSNSDPIDPNYTDDNCDGSDGDVEHCVFASPSIGSATATGTRLDPVDTIAHAIATAQANGVPSVCLSGETFNENVTVPSGISIYGGFNKDDPDFKFRRSASVTTTVIASGTVFDVPVADVDTHIEGITIIANSSGVSGSSTIGVRFGGGNGQLYVRWDTITAADGSAGGPGMNGAGPNPTNAPAGANGLTGQSNGSNGGTGGPQGTCTDFGGAGGIGGYGQQNGANGSPGTCSTPGGVGGQPDSASFCSGGSGNNVGQPGNACTIPGTDGGAGPPGGALGTVQGGDYSPRTAPTARSARTAWAEAAPAAAAVATKSAAHSAIPIGLAAAGPAGAEGLAATSAPAPRAAAEASPSSQAEGQSR